MKTRHLFRAATVAALFLLSALPLRAQLFMEEIVVFAVDTLPKQTQFLQLGKSYEFHLSGTYSFWDNAEGDSVGLVDAAYYREIPPGEFGLPGWSTTTTNGFLIDAQPISTRITPPGVSPTYTYLMPYRGQGRPADVFIEDHPPFSVDRHSDNHGAIRVRLYNVSPEIAVDSALIDFGEVELGEWRDTVIVFENVGYGPLFLTDPRIAGTDAAHFSVTAADTYTLQPGERDSLTVRFAPLSVFQKTAALVFETNDSDSPVITIPLTGVGVTTLEAGCMSTLTAPSQEYSLLPVTLFTNRDGSNTTSFAFDLLYDRTLLLPDGIELRGTLSESFDVNMTVVQPGLLRITATNGQPLTGTGTLLYLRVFAAWRDPSVSPLDVENLVFNAGNPRARIVDGAVEIDSLCNQYLKSVHRLGLPRLEANHPNPFNPSTTVHFFLPAAAELRLSVHDATGRELRVLADGLMPAGEHSLPFTAGSLPSGTYYLRLVTGGHALLRPMLLLR